MGNKTSKTSTKKASAKKNQNNALDFKLAVGARITINTKTINFNSRTQTTKDKILFTYANECRKARRILTRNEMPKFCKIMKPQGEEYVEVSITRDSIRHHVGEFNEMKIMAQESFPELFTDVVEPQVYIPRQMEKLGKVIADKSIKRYVLTTAIADAPVHRGFLKTLKQYCKKEKAKLLILPADNNYASIDNSFHDDKDMFVIFDEQRINDNLFISNIKIKPTMLNPLTGLDRICHKQNSSLVIPSPKQSMKPVPTKKGFDPHVLFSTGACTYPDYHGEKYGTTSRRDYMATNDHVMGAVIVEVEDNETFYFRPIQAESTGAFIDLGKKYFANGKVRKERAEAISLGDWHSIEKQWDVCRIFVEEVAKEVNAKEVILHDFFDGQSISHHEKDSVVRRSALALDGKLSLADEFKEGVKDLNYLSKYFEKIVMVPSNHNEFVDRLLNDKRWLKDAENNYLCSLLFPYAVFDAVMNDYKDSKLATEIVAKSLGMDTKFMKRQNPDIGKSPVQVGCEMYDLKQANKVKWLKRDEEYKIAGCELGQHGDKGPHGSRGSANSLEKVLGNAIIGHSHTPCWHFGIIQNGTLSRLDPAYATGPSAWMHTSTILYKNGAKQPINVIGKKWRLNK